MVDEAPAQYFRAGVGGLIVNGDGLVLALERADVPGAWQCPQGGLDPGEEPADAVLREIREETGLAPDDLELLEAYPVPLAYELPEALRSARNGRGQVQYWFLFRLRGSDRAIDLEAGGEFRAWRWMRFADLLDSLAAFRRPVYRALQDRFAAALV